MSSSIKLLSAKLLLLSLGGCATCQTRPDPPVNHTSAAGQASMLALNAEPKTSYTYTADAICRSNGSVHAWFSHLPTGLDGLKPGDRIRIVPAAPNASHNCEGQQLLTESTVSLSAFRSLPGGVLQFELVGTE